MGKITYKNLLVPRWQTSSLTQYGVFMKPTIILLTKWSLKQWGKKPSNFKEELKISICQLNKYIIFADHQINSPLTPGKVFHKRRQESLGSSGICRCIKIRSGYVSIPKNTLTIFVGGRGRMHGLSHAESYLMLIESKNRPVEREADRSCWQNSHCWFHHIQCGTKWIHESESSAGNTETL